MAHNSVCGPTSFHLSDMFAHEFSVCKINSFQVLLKSVEVDALLYVL